VQDFAQEILLLDPTGDLFLKEYFLGEHLDWSKVGGGSNLLDLIKEKISLDIDTIGTYSELLQQQIDKKIAIDLFLANYKEKEKARSDFFLDLQKKYGANLVNKWTTNVITYDFPTAMADKGKVANKGKRANRNPIVPHEPKKPQGETKKSQPKKLKPTFKITPTGAMIEGASDSLNIFISETESEENTFKDNPRNGLFLHLEKYIEAKKTLPDELNQFDGYLSGKGNNRNLLFRDLSVIFAEWSIPKKIE
jgi:hypothetical protein